MKRVSACAIASAFLLFNCGVSVLFAADEFVEDMRKKERSIQKDDYIAAKKYRGYFEEKQPLQDQQSISPTVSNKQTRIKPVRKVKTVRKVKPVRQVSPAPEPVKAAADMKCNKFTFDATGSYVPTNEKLTYLWDFGDGAASTEPVVTHIYEKAGEYTVKLTVRDSSGLECDTSIADKIVKVNTPPQAGFTGPQETCTGEEVTFDAGATVDNTPETLTFSWDFGDGTKGEGQTVSKVYQKGGSYKVMLSVNDNSNTSCDTDTFTAAINVNAAPTADSGKDIDKCFATGQELKVDFDGGASRDPDNDALTYQWNFGDGVTASGKAVSHVYGKPGTYAVTLSVDDGRGSSCSSSSDTAEVRVNREPVADAGKNIIACAAGAVTLDGSRSQGEGLSYTWDFGDGESGQGVITAHTYSKGGTYKAVLNVNDGKSTRCSSSSSTVTVFVNSSPAVTLKNAESACTGEAVKFAASAKDPDGDSLLYSWDFGDGTEIKGSASESHEYAQGGTYTVRVTVNDKRDTSCSSASAVSKVRINSRPVANAGPNLVCCIDKVADFVGSGSRDPDGDTLKYHWDFGDGATAEGANVSHAYTKAGTYTVTLSVDDNTGTSCSSSTSSFEARVKDSPDAVIKVK